MAPRPRVVLIDAAEQVAELLAGMRIDFPLHVHHGDPSPERLRHLLRDAEIVLDGHSYLSADDIAAAPDLRTIIFLGTGASSYIDLAAARERGIEVRTVKGYGDRAVAEHAIALALGAIRHVSRMDRDLRRGHWAPLEGRELAELSFGAVGQGGIGREAARLAVALGLDVMTWNRSPGQPVPGARAVALGALLGTSDIVSLHLGLTEATRGFIDRTRLGLLRPGAIIVNTARAELIDRGALLDALEAGRIAHAALDVFDTEPLPVDDPLVALPNVTLTAHAGFKTRSATRRLLEAALALVPRS